MLIPDQRRLNRLGCSRTERNPLSEESDGMRYSPDCSAPPECYRLRSRRASTLEPGKNPSLVGETTPPRPCRCRHTAGCNEKECPRSLQPCLRPPQLHATSQWACPSRVRQPQPTRNRPECRR